VSLLERLEELRRTKSIVPPPNLPRRPRTEEALERLEARFALGQKVEKVDFDQLRDRIKSLHQANSLSRLSLRELRLTASCLFDGPVKLADDTNFLEQYFAVLNRTQSRMILKRLILSYCVHFNRSHVGTRYLGAFLSQAVPAYHSHSEWAERHRVFRFFNPELAPRELASFVSEANNPKAELAAAGLTGQLWGSALSASVLLHGLKTIRARLEKTPRLEEVERAIAWVSPGKTGPYFLANRSDLIETLLLPWADRDPPTVIRDRIQTFLLDTFNDPRIDRGSWVGTDETAREIIVRWLAQATLEQFLKVVDRVAAAHQWEYRRAFWNAYIGRGWVSNAWVAFASDGAAVANQIAADTGDKLMRRFASLNGASANQAVLLLQIGDLFIADWSHNGKLRIWRRGNTSSPKFNEPAYVATTLRSGSDFDIAHLPPDGWQAKAESYIRRFTGLKLSSIDFMPRNRR
jgi:hypothetical protein